MPYRTVPSRDEARRRLARRLAAAIVTRRGLTSPGPCRRWLPPWLPVNSLAPLMFEAGGQLPDHIAAHNLPPNRHGRAPAPLGDPARGTSVTPRTRRPIRSGEEPQSRYGGRRQDLDNAVRAPKTAARGRSSQTSNSPGAPTPGRPTLADGRPPSRGRPPGTCRRGARDHSPAPATLA